MAGKNRAQNRENRRADRARSKDHTPLISMAQAEQGRRPPKKPRMVAPSPLTDRQADYENAIKTNDVIFGTGPAGTGKTWYAAMMAANALHNKEIEKIVVTRPAVEAGENLGFLPGEQEEKYEPYFRPVREALEEFFGESHAAYLIDNKVIEARPLAYIRGATIKNTWLIADEMQNATTNQTLMLLTRIGEGSKFIINGDPAQDDLPYRVQSGLIDAVKRLSKIKRIQSVTFTAADIVRHGLIQEIIEAYQNDPCKKAQPERYREREDDNLDGLKRTLRV